MFTINVSSILFFFFRRKVSLIYSYLSQTVNVLHHWQPCWI